MARISSYGSAPSCKPVTSASSGSLGPKKQTAPMEVKRRPHYFVQLFMLAFYSGALSSLDALEGLSWRFVGVRLGQTAVPLVVLVALLFIKRERICEYGMAITLTVWGSAMMWVLELIPRSELAGEPGVEELVNANAIFVILVSMVCVGLRLELLIGSTLVQLCNFVCLWVLHTVRKLPEPGVHHHALRSALMAVMMAACLVNTVFEKDRVYKMLAAEQQASKALVSSLCDARFWLAHDGETIVSGDRQLDTLMGMCTTDTTDTMEGKTITDFLTDSERSRFKKLAKRPIGTVTVHHTEFLRPQGPPLPVQIFIASVYLSTSGKHGYLVGLRHAEHLEAAPVATAALNRQPPMHQEFQDLPSPMDSGLFGGFEGQPGDLLYPCGSRSPDALSRASLPVTMASRALDTLRVQSCRRAQVLPTISRQVGPLSTHMEETLCNVLALCCDHAKGGALICVAEHEAFNKVFSNDNSGDNSDSQRAEAIPTLRASDGGYMTKRLRGLHVSDPDFVAAFESFTEHSETDRWPTDHRDLFARGQPKDGALILDVRGFRLKAAAKILGLHPVKLWEGVGTKHEAAMATAWAVNGCIAVVRSDAGNLHFIARNGCMLHALRVIAD